MATRITLTKMQEPSNEFCEQVDCEKDAQYEAHVVGSKGKGKYFLCEQHAQGCRDKEIVRDDTPVAKDA